MLLSILIKAELKFSVSFSKRKSRKAKKDTKINIKTFGTLAKTGLLHKLMCILVNSERGADDPSKHNFHKALRLAN